MRALSLVEYTTAGAVAGGAFTALGAAVCHPIEPDAFQIRPAAIAGFVGGAATHGVIGLVAAFEKHRPATERLKHVGASLPLAALTSGLVGGAILGAAGLHNHPGPNAIVLSGIIGGGLIACAAATATFVSCLCCRDRPRWTAIATGDLGEGDILTHETGEEIQAAQPPGRSDSARPEHGHHRSIAERLLPFEREGSRSL